MDRDRVKVSPESLVDLLRLRAAERGHDIAFGFAAGDDGKTENLTYGELDEQARRVGSAIASQGFADQRILLAIPPGLDYVKGFFGCLYGGAVPVPSYTPRTKRTLDAQLSVVSNCAASAILAPKATRLTANRLLGDALNEGRLKWLDLEDLLAVAESDWQPPNLTDRSLCYLQYTSGSTGAPKGVRVRHTHVLRNLESLAAIIGPSASDHIVSWLPPFHDMGLVGGILTPLFTGIPATLLSPTAAISRPLRWLRAITASKATVTVAPNFAFDLCVREIREDQKAELDLSGLKVVFVGAEPVRAETLSRFARAFEACGFDYKSFYPCYGMAEATLIVSGGLPRAEPVVRPFDRAALQVGMARSRENRDLAAQELVGCGFPIDGTTIEIVDPDRRVPCDSSSIGEIWIAGPCVADGYWNRSKESNRTFRARLKDREPARFLRTGDLGFVADGELFVTGRLKDMIIIRGRNLFPEEIESCVGASHAALRPGAGAAFSIDLAGEESYAVVQEVKHRHRSEHIEVISAIRAAVAEAMEAEPGTIALVKPGAIPRTTSGKIKRSECRKALNDGSLAVIADWYRSRSSDLNALNGEPGFDAMLYGEVGRLLGVPVRLLDRSVPLSRLGIDSLKALQLVDFIGASFKIDIDETETVSLLDSVTLDQLSLLVSARTKLGSSISDDRKESNDLYELIDAMSDEEVTSMLNLLEQRG